MQSVINAGPRIKEKFYHECIITIDHTKLANILRQYKKYNKHWKDILKIQHLFLLKEK